MSLKLGNTDLSKVMLGSQEVSAVYRGADEVWSLGGSGGTYVDDVFSTYVYEGTSAEKDIVNGVDLAGEGGMAWLKQRTGSAKPHYLFDTERGNQQSLSSNDNAAAFGSGLKLKAFNSDGFRLGAEINVNGSGEDYTSWTFRKAPKFFDVVTYTGDGVAGRQIPHNLGIEPGMVIVKSTSNDSNWIVTHASIPDHYLTLDTADSKQSDVKMVTTDSTISWTGSDVYYNRLGREYVAYVFAHDDSDESMIKCGSFTGNPAKIDLGFEPQWMIAKKYDASSPWQMFDAMRGWTGDGGTYDLVANGSDSENDRSSQNYTQLNSDGVTFNSYGGSWVYMAIRRPNKPAEEFKPEELFAIDADYTSGGDPRFTSGFPVDFAFRTKPATSDPKASGARLIQGTELVLNTDSASRDRTQHKFDYMDGWTEGSYAAWASWMWRRAPGFMDVVTYEGNGVTGREVDHNLGVMPEMVIHKHRSHSSNWTVWHHQVSGPGREWWEYGGNLNEDYAFGDKNTQQSDPTSSTWPVESGWTNVAGRTNVLYLFASVPGISKVGSYTGNGSEVEVDCGFTNGARWLLIKRTDSAGDWYFTSNPSNFKTLSKLNTTDAQVNHMSTFNDVPSGFRVVQYSSNDLCVDGAEYIFYAVAHSDTSRATDAAKAIKNTVKKKVRDTVKQKAKEVVVDKVKNSKDIKDDS